MRRVHESNYHQNVWNRIISHHRRRTLIRRTHRNLWKKEKGRVHTDRARFSLTVAAYLGTVQTEKETYLTSHAQSMWTRLKRNELNNCSAWTRETIRQPSLSSAMTLRNNRDSDYARLAPALYLFDARLTDRQRKRSPTKTAREKLCRAKTVILTRYV